MAVYRIRHRSYPNVYWCRLQNTWSALELPTAHQTLRIFTEEMKAQTELPRSGVWEEVPEEQMNEVIEELRRVASTFDLEFEVRMRA